MDQINGIFEYNRDQVHDVVGSSLSDSESSYITDNFCLNNSSVILSLSKDQPPKNS